jgi:hypothetical protein
MTERNASLLDAQDALVRDRDAMRATAPKQAGPCSGPANGGFAQTTPSPLRSLLLGLETDVSSSSFPLSKTFDELPTEQPRQSSGGNE